jgi:hypothetical protein
VENDYEIWNMECWYRMGSMKTVASKVAKYNLDIDIVHEVRWVEGDRQSAYDFTVLCVEL